MNKAINKTLVAAAVTAVLSLATSGAMAQSFPDFTVNESSVTGALANTIVADKITGNYVEVITFTGAPTAGTFDVSLRWNAGQFVANDGKDPVGSQLNGIASQTANYGLYALYTGSGNYALVGKETVFTFTPGGTLKLYSDSGNNTTFNQPTNGANGFSTNFASDDTLLALGVPTAGEGRLDTTLTTCPVPGVKATTGINCGSFGASSTFALTAAGSAYFVEPSPFYQLSFQSGQLNNFTPTDTQVINGSLDVVFGGLPNAVPEPTTVALLGLGLLGFAVSRRKSANSKNV